MSYIGKHTLLTAYTVLSQNTSNPSTQGATQIVSALRYLFALDRFVKQQHRGCITINKADKEEFIGYVGDIVSVNQQYYTSNFYTDLKDDVDFKVGSNFFSVNVVTKSIADPLTTYEFPRRSKDGGLLVVRNGVLSINKDLYVHLDKYLSNSDTKVAFAIWLCRKWVLTEDVSFDTIFNSLCTIYSLDLIRILLPSQNEFKEYLIKYGEIEVSNKCVDIQTSEIYELFDNNNSQQTISDSKYRPYITAIKSKPFLLLAGISGTGKSRIVRELARACWPTDSDEYKVQKPSNFEMIQVKPNWHDSTELIGYVSRVSGKPEFIPGEFLRFLARAWENIETPYFLCLDEMNLAPVEQYFAEYLSVIESRKAQTDGSVGTDPILKRPNLITKVVEYAEGDANKDWYAELVMQLTDKSEVIERFMRDGICIPQNLIVIGTVNMDETTFSFSRKVLDRAMTIEMNEVDLYGGLKEVHEPIGLLSKNDLIGTNVEGKDVYADNEKVCNLVIEYLIDLNNQLENTPFKIAYRTRNEFLLYVVNNLPYNKDSENNDLPENYVIARALDEITSMKILSRIEGDDTKVSQEFLSGLSSIIKERLDKLAGEEHLFKSLSVAKLDEMSKRLNSGYVSFWS